MTRPLKTCRDPWADLRQRRILCLIALLGFVPVVAPLAVLTARLGDWQWLVIVVALGWAAFLVITGLRVHTFPCPRCHKWFAWSWWWHNALTDRCLHCGLREGEGSESSAPAPD
jgi:hypothetical protein